MVMIMKTLSPDTGLAALSALCPARLQTVYTPYLQATPALELKTAMEYTLQNGGKYLRPLLIYATGSLFNAALENLDVPASAVELIHTYSLIHDDLPCMDNADLRRGKPACHKAQGEGIAVLTGDALHTLAMQILACHPAPLKEAKRLQMIQTLTTACGPFGMAAGQALDLTVMGDKTLSTDLLLDIYRLKTGALFTACIELGRLASADEDDANQQALREFGDCMGLAFQIQDDILDIEASTQQLGKPQGMDVKNQKVTYPQVMGMQQAKDKVQALYQEALVAIDYLGGQAQLLRELAGVMLGR
jgi:farnesyl diphosphate synthase